MINTDTPTACQVWVQNSGFTHCNYPAPTVPIRYDTIRRIFC